jgi:alkanesulfonate monooxygenase SsuD/methylene tetrahydromethanopterin reductase-like flavin-dependent oxidoreductase (luciferase family)
MKYGLSLPNFGEFADPTVTVELAVLAEESGWDGFFVWDHIVVADGMPVGDPWVHLGAIAQATDRLTIGPMVTPLPRRRPWVVARQATAVDHLSGGRLILGVGIGFPPDAEFGTFGESTDDRERADMLDEYYSVRPTRFAPTPVRGAIPIWVAASWANVRPLRRAARFQGVFPVKMDMSAWTPAEVEELTAIMRRERGDLEGFDVVVGSAIGAGRDTVQGYQRAGASWFIGGPDPGGAVDGLRAAIAAGPN